MAIDIETADLLQEVDAFEIVDAQDVDAAAVVHAVGCLSCS